MMGLFDTLLALLYETRYLTAQGTGGLDALALLTLAWVTIVLAASVYRAHHRPRERGWLVRRVGYGVAAAFLVACRVTGRAPLASPLWLWVSLLSGVYILGGDLLDLRLDAAPSAMQTTIPPHPETRLRGGALILLLFTLAWASVEYIRHRTTGVSGSDPFCYVQMAVDFARHGTLAHRFPLTAQARAWGLSPEPTLPVGYWLPGGTDMAISSYSFGFPLLLAVGYAVGGEGGLWLVTPVLALAAVGATWVLAQVLFRDEPRGRRWTMGAVAAWIVATSYTQMRLAIVPMSDVPAQLFSTLTLILALAAEHRRQELFSALAGAALGMAYLVRHTSLALLAPLMIILARSRPRPRRWWRRQATLLLTAALVALPDLLYHQRWLGGFWHGENPEIGRQAGLIHVGPSLAAFVEYLAYPGEFGWLLPLLLAGGYGLWRGRRTAFTVLVPWTLALVIVYAPVHTTALFQNGARYLLPAFPALALMVSAGVVCSLKALPLRRPRALAALLALVAPFVLRTPVHKPLLAQYPTFGYLSPSQRAEFAALSAALPEDAVIAGSDVDSGPLAWYTGRAIARPQAWSGQEFTRFLRLAADNDIPVYLLDDGSLGTLVQQHSFQPLDRFAIGRPDHPVEELYSLTFVHQGGER
ncbi:MAG: glycosyltransferase family 39 protein [Anaerolineae bacterium]|nr:glycosyltransferase family 39 protein [Anaerolineae bacterium]